MEKVALITASSPDSVMNGTVVEIRKIAGFSEEQWLTWIQVGGVTREEQRPLKQVRLEHLVPWNRPFRFFASKLGDACLRSVWTRIAGRRVAELCQSRGVARIWAFAEQTVPMVAMHAARMAGLALHVTVHDHPFRVYQLYPDRPAWYWQNVEKDCIAMLRAADSVDVVSRAFVGYVRQYTDCPVSLYVPRMPAVAEGERRGESSRKPALPPCQASAGGDAKFAKENKFRIGFNGCMHTDMEELVVFLKWLERIGGDYEFHVFGPGAVLPSAIPMMEQMGKVVRYGYQPDYERIDTLAEMEAFYLGAWFSTNKDLTVRYSFPSKVAVVLAAGVPLICHGPDYWEVVMWLKEIKFGVWIDNIDARTIPPDLERFVKDRDFRLQYAKGVKEVFEKYFRMPDNPLERKLPWESLEE